MESCRICDGTETHIIQLKKKKYIECHACGGICTARECLTSLNEQKNRYEQHHNSLSDDGYRAFLESFIKPVLSFLKEKHNNLEGLRILDYGSGPEPALCELLSRYSHEGMLLEHNTEIRGWDPFFAPETKFYEDGADLVTCLEVAEHFENPLVDMMKLSNACRKGGYAAIGTMILPEPDEERNDFFKNWWYRSDATHVAFYTLKSLFLCAGKCGLSFEKAVTDRAFVFRKTV